jgi:hypothetical protein
VIQVVENKVYKMVTSTSFICCCILEIVFVQLYTFHTPTPPPHNTRHLHRSTNYGHDDKGIMRFIEQKL